jgi:hypothetical protein
LVALGKKNHVHAGLFLCVLDVQGKIAFGFSMRSGALAGDDLGDGVVGPTLLWPRLLACDDNLRRKCILEQYINITKIREERWHYLSAITANIEH